MEESLVPMERSLSTLHPQERRIADLLLQGCTNVEIAQALGMNPRTVKSHFNRLFFRFGIEGGVKRVKLATLLYRSQLCSERSLIHDLS